MGKIRFFLLALASCFAVYGNEGIEVGNLLIRPETDVTGSYDNRVNQLPDGSAEGDFYADAAVGARISNLPARFSFYSLLRYGYRIYLENDGFNDDFYNVRLALRSEQSPLKWGLSGDLAKTLNYNTGYDPETGQRPDTIIADYPNQRVKLSGNISYDIAMTDKTAVRPQYLLDHYYQELVADETAEWQIHRAGIQLRRAQSEKITYTLGGFYALQMNDDEEGYIATVTAGAEGRLSDKTSWALTLGYAVADYELSGTDQGVVSDLEGRWRATDKLSAYVFGGNNFQPGYAGGGARVVYRLGYGINWDVVERLGFNAGLLHDYQQVVGGGDASGDPSIGVFRSYFNTSVSYAITQRFFSSLGYRYQRDEDTPDRQVAYLKLGYRF